MLVHLQVVSGVVVVFEPVVGGGPRGDVQHSDLQLVQRLIGQRQVSDQLPDAVITVWKQRNIHRDVEALLLLSAGW